MPGEIVTKASRFYCVSVKPDICKTPIGASTPPIPYTVKGEFSDAVGVSSSITSNDEPVVIHASTVIPTVAGDEAGTAKGVKSGTVAGRVQHDEKSSTVSFNGERAIRVGDSVFMNDKNTIGKVFERSTPSGPAVVAGKSDVSSSTSDPGPAYPAVNSSGQALTSADPIKSSLDAIFGCHQPLAQLVTPAGSSSLKTAVRLLVNPSQLEPLTLKLLKEKAAAALESRVLSLQPMLAAERTLSTLVQVQAAIPNAGESAKGSGPKSKIDSVISKMVDGLIAYAESALVPDLDNALGSTSPYLKNPAQPSGIFSKLMHHKSMSGVPGAQPFQASSPSSPSPDGNQLLAAHAVQIKEVVQTDRPHRLGNPLAVLTNAGMDNPMKEITSQSSKRQAIRIAVDGIDGGRSTGTGRSVAVNHIVEPQSKAVDNSMLCAHPYHSGCTVPGPYCDHDGTCSRKVARDNKGRLIAENPSEHGYINFRMLNRKRIRYSKTWDSELLEIDGIVDDRGTQQGGKAVKVFNTAFSVTYKISNKHCSIKTNMALAKDATQAKEAALILAPCNTCSKEKDQREAGKMVVGGSSPFMLIIDDAGPATYAHEFGHFLGLFHWFNDKESVMSYEGNLKAGEVDVIKLLDMYRDPDAYHWKHSKYIGR